MESWTSMPDATTTPTPISLFKTIIWNSFTKLAISELLASLGIAAGPLGWIVTQVVTLISDRIYAVASMLLDLGTIKLRNAIHQAQFDNASEKLGIIAAEYDTTTPEFQKAHQDEQTAFYNLVSFNSDPLHIN
jgi:hypothetical protein